MNTKNKLLPQLDKTLCVERNGVILSCPFMPPIVTAGNVHSISGKQEINVQKMPCSTGCPFASVVNYEGIYSYIIECGPEKIAIDCDKVQGKPGQFDEFV